ncbi:right-handed parallel beta-helix repeat-containing protein [Acidobacteriota bacterium]
MIEPNSSKRRMAIEKILVFGGLLCTLAFVIASQAVLAQSPIPVSLTILNERDPVTYRIVVVQGDPVEVLYDVNPNILSSPRDEIQLRRVDNGSVVSYESRGPNLSGTVYLDTNPANALGELEVVYVDPADTILGRVDETLMVVEDGQAGPPKTVRVPSPEAPTIQAAIDAVADGGKVLIGPGTYEETFYITGKQVNLIGSGIKGKKKRTVLLMPPPDTILPVEEAIGIVNYGPGGGGQIKGMILSGGDTGILGMKDAAGLPARLQVKDMVIQNGGRGILGSFSKLIVKDVRISDILWHGIHLYDLEAVDLFDNLVSDVDGVGLLIYNFDPSPGSINIRDTKIAFAGQGGIAIVGGEKPVYITDCNVGFCMLAGILLIDADHVELKKTDVKYIFMTDTPEYSDIGDGLIVDSTGYVNLRNCKFTHCDRAGILFHESGGAITGTVSRKNGMFGLVVLGSVKPDYEDRQNIFEGRDTNILTDGSLPVPDEPMPVAEMP